jgi:hypothetical protein
VLLASKAEPNHLTLIHQRNQPQNRRALLRGAQVLAMDEGTANLDAATDATIQQTLNRLLRRPASASLNKSSAGSTGSTARGSRGGGSSKSSSAATAAAAAAATASTASSDASGHAGRAGGGSGRARRASNACAALSPPGCSLIVVAHRLETVAHCDNLLVMSQGRVLEQGAPAALAALPRGVYAAMLRAMREATAAAQAAAAVAVPGAPSI